MGWRSPDRSMLIETGHATHVGLRREHNEDTYYADGALGLWLVADGMGGHEQGEVASALARREIVSAIEAGDALEDSIRAANAAIIAHAGQRRQRLPMGTTVAAVRVQGTQYLAAWVGDSRIYRCREGQLTPISADHSYVRTLIDQGVVTPEQARTHPHRNVITQALGVTDAHSLHVEQVACELHAGDQLLLCSDGLTEEVDDATIQAIVARTELSAQECVDHLMLAALDGGGSDNITVVLLRVL